MSFLGIMMALTSMILPTVYVLVLMYAFFEKLVHKVDRGELSEKQQSKLLWISSVVVDLVIIFFIYLIIESQQY